jgi:hypothetical protein
MKRASQLIVLILLLFLCCGIALAAFIYKRNIIAKRFEEILNVLETEKQACIIKGVSLEPPRTERGKARVTRVIARCDNGEAKTFAKRFATLLKKYRDRVRFGEVYNYVLPNAYEITFEGTSSVLNIGWYNPSEPWVEYRIEEPPLKGTIFLKEEARSEINALIESIPRVKFKND